MFIVAMLLMAWGGAWVGMKSIGYALLRGVYEGRLEGLFPASWLAGRELHSLAHYQSHLDHLFWRSSFLAAGLAIALGAFWIIGRFSFGALMKLPAWGLAALLGLLALAFCPPVFDGVFSCGTLPAPWGGRVLWVLCLGIVVLACLLLWHRQSLCWKKACVTLAVLMIWELATRGILRSGWPEWHQRLNFYAQRTYFSTSAFAGHPFLQFTGRTGERLQADAVLAGVGPFNKAGFPGREIGGAKAPGVIRVVALGGSTTADGYPEVMEKWLNAEAPGHYFEVYNFGLGWHNSAHSVACFMLNAVHLQPDYVVILQGWNDASARNVPPEIFRTDYSHAYTPFHAPFIWDKHLIRLSLLYRLVRESLVPRPAWWGLDEAIIDQHLPRTEPEWGNLDELKPYESNIRAIIEVAQARKMRTVLATSPRSTNAVSQAHTATHIDQCNDVLRRLAAEEQAILVDLDREMTGPMNEHFLDLGHLDRVGIEGKAQRIGEAIRRDVKGRQE